ncbi:MAG: hypothetical protein P4L51_05125 [Puia sp.]|nr:hypothetical protein [Puia sp.]
MKRLIASRLSTLLVLLVFSREAGAQGKPADTASTHDKTSFQIAAPWKAAYDVRSDIAIVYGMNGSFPERVKSYRDRGYNVQFMTGIAWGEYQDYFAGRFDGKTHPEDGQVRQNGDTVWHGKGVPYVVPSPSYLAYMKSLVKRAIDGGVTAIYLEEPEFWAKSGYSDSFKKEWQHFYGFPWMAQHESPEATYLSSKLKYHLYFNALKEVFSYAKTYSEGRGARVKCYVPTHSLLNYSAWEIVSPEASLAALPGMDGYIAQVWTGTSREPTYFDGVEKERVFENAFLEYGSMLSMTAPTGRRIYFLTDPIEDYPRTWDDYRRNYEATFTAELMYPTVDHFEVMPWPNRIYQGKFKVENSDSLQPIAPDFATQMQVMVNSLNNMPLSGNRVNGSPGIGVLVSNSMMFQRFPTHKGYEDPQLSDFYGMVLPLLKTGVPVETVHMENLSFPGTLQGIRVLVMSYSNMKPPSAEVHRRLADWVKKGGMLIYYGRDQDPFQGVREWWNTNGNHYRAPSEHLFRLMGLHPDGSEFYSFGKGKLVVVRKDPKELVMERGGAGRFLELVKAAYTRFAKSGRLQAKNYFYLERGPYTIASVMDESVSSEPLSIAGPVIDLFDPLLPVLPAKQVRPGEQAFLYALSRSAAKDHPSVLCAASRVYEEVSTGHSYSFLTKSPSGTQNSMRIALPAAPLVTKVTGPDGRDLEGVSVSWDADTKTVLLRFQNDCDGVRVRIEW